MGEVHVDVHQYRRLDVEQAFVRALSGHCQRIARLHLDRSPASGRPSRRTERARSRSRRAGWDRRGRRRDVEDGLGHEAQLDADGIDQPQEDGLTAFVFRVLEGRHREGLLGRSSAREGERASARGCSRGRAWRCRGRACSRRRPRSGSSSPRARLSRTATVAVPPSVAPKPAAVKATVSGRHAHRAEQRDLVDEVACADRRCRARPAPSRGPRSGRGRRWARRCRSPCATRLANGKRSCFQPMKSSLKPAVQRSASSRVEPGLRFSIRSTKRSVPLPVPYSQSAKPSYRLQSCGTQAVSAASWKLSITPAKEVDVEVELEHGVRRAHRRQDGRGGVRRWRSRPCSTRPGT